MNHRAFIPTIAPLAASLLVLLAFLASCGESSAEKSAQGTKPRVITTIGMIADVAANIAGDRADVAALMGPGVDPHLYKASPGDVRTLAAADLVLFSGLHLEGRLADTLVQMASRTRVARVTEGLNPADLREPPEFEGHPDPHVWFDVSLWKQIIPRIRDELSTLRPEHKAEFEAAAAAYAAKLDSLHTWAKASIATIPQESRLLVTAHDAFGYFGRAYGLEVRAVQGISTDSEASLKSINELVDTIVARKVPAVFFESSVPAKAVEALIEGARAKGHEVRVGGELFSDAMGPANTPEGTYIGMVEHNVRVIVAALGGKAEPR